MSKKSRQALQNQLETLERRKLDGNTDPGLARQIELHRDQVVQFDLRISQELKEVKRDSKYQENLVAIKRQREGADPAKICRSLVIRRQRSWLYLQLLHCQIRLEIGFKDLNQFQQQVPVVHKDYGKNLVEKITYYARQVQAIRKNLQFIYQQLVQRQQEFDSYIPEEHSNEEILNTIIHENLAEGYSIKDHEFWALIGTAVKTRVSTEWLSLMEKTKKQTSISIESVNHLSTELYRFYKQYLASLQMAIKLYDDMGANQKSHYDGVIQSCQGKKGDLHSMIANLIRDEKSLINQKAVELKTCIRDKYLPFEKWYSSMDILVTDKVVDIMWLRGFKFTSAHIYLRVTAKSSKNSLYLINYLDDINTLGDIDSLYSITVDKGQLDKFDLIVSLKDISRNKLVPLTLEQKVKLPDQFEPKKKMLDQTMLPISELIDWLNFFLGSIFYKGKEEIKDAKNEAGRGHSQEAWEEFVSTMYKKLSRTKPTVVEQLAEEDAEELSRELISPENTRHEGLQSRMEVSLTKSRKKGIIKAGLGAQRMTTVIAYLRAFNDVIVQEEKGLPAGLKDFALPSSLSLANVLRDIKTALGILIAALELKEKQVVEYDRSLDVTISASTTEKDSCQRATEEIHKKLTPVIVKELSTILIPVTTTEEKQPKVEPMLLSDASRLTTVLEHITEEEKLVTAVASLRAIDSSASLFEQMQQFDAIAIPRVESTPSRLRLNGTDLINASSLPIQKKILNGLLHQRALTWRAEAKQKDAQISDFKPKNYDQKKPGDDSILGIKPYFFDGLISSQGAKGFIKKFREQLKDSPSAYKELESLFTSLDQSLTHFQKEPKVTAVDSLIDLLQTSEQKIVFFLKQQFTRLAEPMEKAHATFLMHFAQLAGFKQGWEDLVNKSESEIKNYIGQIQGKISSIAQLKGIKDYPNLIGTFNAHEGTTSQKYQKINAILNPLFKWIQPSSTFKEMNEATWTAIANLQGLTTESKDFNTTFSASQIIDEIKKGKTGPSKKKNSVDYTNSLVVSLFRKMHSPDRGMGIEQKQVESFLLATQGVQQLAMSLLLFVEAGGGEKVSLQNELYNLILKECAGKSIAAKRHFLIDKCSEQIFKLITVLQTREKEFSMLQQHLGMPVSESSKLKAEKNILDTLINTGRKIGDLTHQLDKILLPQREIDELHAEREALPYGKEARAFTECVDKFVYKFQVPGLFDKFPIKIARLDEDDSPGLDQLLELPSSSPVSTMSVSPKLDSKQSDLKSSTAPLQTAIERDIDDGCAGLLALVAPSEDSLLGITTPAPAAELKTDTSQSAGISPKAIQAELQSLSCFDPDNQKPEHRIPLPQSLIRLVNRGSLSEFMTVWFSPYLTSGAATFINAGNKADKGVMEKRGVLGIYLLEEMKRDNPTGETIKILMQSRCYNILNPFNRFARESFSEIKMPSQATIWHTLFITLKLAGLFNETITSAQALYDYVGINDESKGTQYIVKQVASKLNIKICVFIAAELDARVSKPKQVNKGRSTGISLVSVKKGVCRPFVPTKSLTALSEAEISSLFEFTPITQSKAPKRKKTLGSETPVEVADSELKKSGQEAPKDSSGLAVATPTPVAPPIFTKITEDKKTESFSAPLDWGYDTYSRSKTEGEEDEELSLADKIIQKINGMIKKHQDEENDNEIKTELVSSQKSVREFIHFLGTSKEETSKLTPDDKSVKSNVPSLKLFFKPIFDSSDPSESVGRKRKRTVIRILTERFLEKSFEEKFETKQLVDYIFNQLEYVAFFDILKKDEKNEAKKTQAVEEVIALLLACPIEIFIKFFSNARIRSSQTVYASGTEKTLFSRDSVISLLTEALAEDALDKSVPLAKSTAMKFLMTRPCCSFKYSTLSASMDFFELPEMKKFEEALQLGLNISGIRCKVTDPTKTNAVKEVMSETSKTFQVGILLFSHEGTLIESNFLVGKPIIHLYQKKDGSYCPLISASWLAEDQQRILTACEQLRQSTSSLQPESPQADISASVAALPSLSLVTSHSSNSSSSTPSPSSSSKIVP